MRKKRDMRAYQFRAVNWLHRKKNSGLFLEMGLGKTVIEQTVFLELLKQHKGVIVIAPYRVAETVWAQEAKEWEHTKGIRFSHILGSDKQRRAALYAKAQVYLMNVENVAWLVNELAAMQKAKRPLPFDWLVIDESSMFKNTSTTRFRAIRAMLPIFKRRNILTGTPTPNTYLELWPQLYILDQGETLGPSFEIYRNRYFEFDEEVGRYVLKPRAMQAINKRIAPVVLRLDSSLLTNMPKVVTSKVTVTLPREARTIYDRLEADMFVRLNDVMARMRGSDRRGLIEAVNAAVLTGKCHQIANGAIFDSEQRAVWHHVHDAKIDALKEVLDELSGEPTLIAYTYRHDRERLLHALGKDTPVIGGGRKDTLAVVKGWNEGRYPYVLVHARSAGHGLNMQFGGHNLTFFSMLYSLELHDQLIARLARSGQKNPFVNVRYIMAQDTVDLAMLDTIVRKAHGQAMFLNMLRDYQARRINVL